jgi:hypothetical protein
MLHGMLQITSLRNSPKLSLKSVDLSKLPAFSFKYGYSVVKHQKTKGAVNLIHFGIRVKPLLKNEKSFVFDVSGAGTPLPLY